MHIKDFAADCLFFFFLLKEGKSSMQFTQLLLSIPFGIRGLTEINP